MAKTLTPKQLRKQKERLAVLMEAEANGAPIDPAIAARMTKEKEEDLYQIWVEPKGSPTPIPVAPKMPRKYCEMLIEAMNKEIALGREKVWGNPHIVLCKIVSP